MRRMKSIGLMLFLAGCGLPQPVPEKTLTFYGPSSARQQSIEMVSSTTTDKQSTPLEIEFGGMKLLATVDGIGSVTILNYPDVWEAKVALMRFDGQTAGEPPFSPSHCERIRSIASIGYSGSFVRNGFHSIISFEVPAFLSSDLMQAVADAAQSAGLNFSALYLTNPVDKIYNFLDLSLSDGAISNLLGHIEALREQLHLGQKGMEKGSFEKSVTVYSADVICDLISGAAKITMTYPIKGEDRFIKVVYKPMEVRLKPS